MCYVASKSSNYEYKELMNNTWYLQLRIKLKKNKMESENNFLVTKHINICTNAQMHKCINAKKKK